MNVILDLTGNTGFTVNTQSGHQIVTDAGPDFGGENLGARPMELLLAGLGGCSGIDVVNILRKSKSIITDLKIEINATRAEQDPKVFTDIHITYHLQGENIDDKKVIRAIELSQDKYCSASIMLGKTAKLMHHHTINQL